MSKFADFKKISGVVFGNALEWYDYILYAHFSLIFAKVFFPFESEVKSVIFTYLVFAAGFISRPLGGLFFGYIGDKMGRKVALSLSIIMMAVPTTLMAFIPSYQTIGIFAPILVLLVRIVQGASAGGEYAASAIYLSESAHKNNKGLYSSSLKISLCLGTLLGIGVSAIFYQLFSNEELINFWWRVPFGMSIFIALFGIYLRKKLQEVESFTKSKHDHLSEKKILLNIFGANKWEFLKACLIYVGMNSTFYTVNVYLKTYMVQNLHFDPKFGEFLSLCVVFGGLFGSLFFAFVFSSSSQRKLMIFGNCFLIVTIFPAFCFMQISQSFAIFGAFIMGLCVAFTASPFPFVLCSMFSREFRASAVSLAMNVTSVVVGANVPMFLTYVIFKSENILMPSFLCLTCGFISFVTLLFFVKNDPENL